MTWTVTHHSNFEILTNLFQIFSIHGLSSSRKSMFQKPHSHLSAVAFFKAWIKGFL